MAVTEKDITLCGHGSGTPSTKNMYTYLESRYKSIAPNGKHKGVIAVRRLKKITDSGRKKIFLSRPLPNGTGLFMCQKNIGEQYEIFLPFQGRSPACRNHHRHIPAWRHPDKNA